MYDLGNSPEAVAFVVQGLWLQRVRPPQPETLRPTLEWALEMAAGGMGLPPPGFVADVGRLALSDEPCRAEPAEAPAVPGLPTGLLRTYEDHVLGKLYLDATFERAATALRRYRDRDRGRGLAFLLNQWRERAGFDAVHISPTVFKRLLEARPERALGDGWDLLTRDGLLPLLAALYESLIARVRLTAEVLGPEDVFELEHGTALAELGARVALRQVLSAAEHLGAELPRPRPRPDAGRRDVPTHVLDEDTYPVGGFSSLSNRGSIESLVQSQLAYMEPAARPDLFDVKHVRDELLYYARDDNRFLRRRRTFVFALLPDLADARFKDAALPWQRLVLVLGLFVAAVRKLSDWLSTEALQFHFVFVHDGESNPLAGEQALLEVIFREAVANGTVTVGGMAADRLPEQCGLWARRSVCQILVAGTRVVPVNAEGVAVVWIVVDAPCPALRAADGLAPRSSAEEPVAAWRSTLERLLRVWA